MSPADLDSKLLDAAVVELEEKLRLGLTIEQAKEALEHPIGLWSYPIPSEYVDAAIAQYTKAHKLLHNRSNLISMINNEISSGDWYLGPKEDDTYWPVVEKSIRAKLGDKALESIDIASTNILKSLRPPGAEEINRRGLVLGYVQSGKTTNFLSLIAKAADVG